MTAKVAALTPPVRATTAATFLGSGVYAEATLRWCARDAPPPPLLLLPAELNPLTHGRLAARQASRPGHPATYSPQAGGLIEPSVQACLQCSLWPQLGEARGRHSELSIHTARLWVTVTVQRAQPEGGGSVTPTLRTLAVASVSCVTVDASVRGVGCNEGPATVLHALSAVR